MKMRSVLRDDERGYAEMVQVAVTLILALVIGIIVIHQLFISGAGPTDNIDDPNYDADAVAAYNNVRSLGWAGIGLMSISIIVLAASVILSIVRGGLGGARGV